MILIKRGEISKVVVTATEKEVESPTAFTLVFTNDITKVAVTIENAEDISPSPDRYNLFMVDSALFDQEDSGFYTYLVQDQSGRLLERGKMKLVGEKREVKQYTGTPNGFVTYEK